MFLTLFYVPLFNPVMSGHFYIVYIQIQSANIAA